MRYPIEKAKTLLPLPALLEKIGDSEYAKPSCRCPFHDDQNSSFSLYRTDNGAWLWKCFAGCGFGDGVTYLEKRLGLSTRDAMARYCSEAGLDSATKPAAQSGDIFDWQQSVAALTTELKRNLADWRGLSPEFVDWLQREMMVGIHKGKIAFAVHKAGKVIGCHYLASRAKKLWKYYPKGNGTQPLIFSEVRTATTVLCFESQWDAFAIMDKLGWHLNPPANTAVIVTRGSENGKLIAGQCSPDAVVYGFVQNDTPKEDGTIPSEKWLVDVASYASCKVLRVVTPAPNKDANDWTRAGASKSDIESAISNAAVVKAESPPTDVGAAVVDFEAITAELRGNIIAALTDGDSSPAERGRIIADAVVSALCKFGRFYFHSDWRDYPTAMFFDGNRKRLDRVRADSFTAWLSGWMKINRADPIFKFVVAEIETVALSGPYTTGILPESYWAARPGALYLSNGDGDIVKITAEAVQSVDNGTDGVLFAVGRTLSPWKLTEPKDAFETCTLFRDVHCGASHGKELLRVWAYSFPTAPRSKPPLTAIGEIGSGKTRTLKGIAELYGIPVRIAKVEEKLESNFWTSVNEGGLFILDNADTRTRWLADAVAAAATDGCSHRRKLYTDSESVTLRSNAWLGITSANPTFGNDAGLADRVMLIRMESRPGEVTSDAALTAEILANRDAGLSHIALTLQKALADTGPTPAGINARHPDFAAFGVRIGRALGRETEIVAALKAAEADKSAFCLENDNVGAALLAVLDAQGAFTGKAKELFPKLCDVDEELKDWFTPKRIGKRLAALLPHLRRRLAVAKMEPDRKKTMVFTFQATPNAENAGYAGFETVFSENPLTSESNRGFSEIAKETRQTRQDDDPAPAREALPYVPDDFPAAPGENLVEELL